MQYSTDTHDADLRLLLFDLSPDTNHCRVLASLFPRRQPFSILLRHEYASWLPLTPVCLHPKGCQDKCVCYAGEGALNIFKYLSRQNMNNSAAPDLTPLFITKIRVGGWVGGSL